MCRRRPQACRILPRGFSVSCVAYGYTPNRLPRPLEFLGVLNVVSETPIGPFADLKEGTSNGGFVHTSDIDQPELLRFASTAAFGKLHCGEAIPCERLLWAESRIQHEGQISGFRCRCDTCRVIKKCGLNPEGNCSHLIAIGSIFDPGTQSVQNCRTPLEMPPGTSAPQASQ